MSMLPKTEKTPKNPKLVSAGRPKGSPNKFTKVLKQAIVDSFESVGGVNYLIKLAEKDPKTYISLLMKVMPNTIATNTGDDGEDGDGGITVNIKLINPQQKDED